MAAWKCKCGAWWGEAFDKCADCGCAREAARPSPSAQGGLSAQEGVSGKTSALPAAEQQAQTDVYVVGDSRCVETEDLISLRVDETSGPVRGVLESELRGAKRKATEHPLLGDRYVRMLAECFGLLSRKGRIVLTAVIVLDGIAWLFARDLVNGPVKLGLLLAGMGLVLRNSPWDRDPGPKLPFLVEAIAGVIIIPAIVVALLGALVVVSPLVRFVESLF